MDSAVLVLPGAQALVSQILSEGWAHARAWLVRRLGHADGAERSDAAKSDLERRMDTAHAQATALTAAEAVPPRAILEAYWAGYLAALIGERPEFASVLAELAASSNRPADKGTVVNSVTGTVSGNLVQAQDIHGGVRFG
jgi:hypothetical protein